MPSHPSGAAGSISHPRECWLTGLFTGTVADPKGSRQLYPYPSCISPCFGAGLHTAAHGWEGTEPCPAVQMCSPEPWPSPFASKALQNSGFTACSCAASAFQSKQKKPMRWGFPWILSCRAVFSQLPPQRGFSREHKLCCSRVYLVSPASERVTRGSLGVQQESKKQAAPQQAGLDTFPPCQLAHSSHAQWGPARGCAHVLLPQVWLSPLRREKRPLGCCGWLYQPRQCLTALLRSRWCWELWGELITLLFI